MALERAKPPVVIRRSPEGYDVFDGIDNDIRAQAVSSYIKDYYSYVRTARGIEIWRRKPPQRPPDVEAYDRVVLVFNGDDSDALASARDAWKDCKSRGFEVTYWQADERGRWQRRD